MRMMIATWSLIVMFAGSAFSQSETLEAPCPDQKVTALISEYKELRLRRRRLAPGNLDRELSAHNGRLQTVLSSLGVELGHAPVTTRIISQCMGEPDAIRNHRQMGSLVEIYNRELRKAGRKVVNPGKREYLIYFWRGWHDFVFFISEDGVIVDHGWWFAYE